jgi:threonine dehydrogenase-like Zn-dependent dehydrogenase
MRTPMKYCGIGEHFTVPHTMLALILSGIGEEHLKLERVKVPKCGNHQLLARVDAVIACSSDIKLIDQGSEHPLMYGWDISKYPIIIGHEGAVTIVKVGKKLKDQYRVGETFAVQPAIPTGPCSQLKRYRNNGLGISKIGVGYTLPGLFAEYVLFSEEVIDKHCLQSFHSDNVPYFGAALSEPISAVIAAQERIIHIIKRNPSSSRSAIIGPKEGGITLILGAGPMGMMHIEVAMSYHPRILIVSEIIDERRKRAADLFKEKAKNLGIRMIFTDPSNLQRNVKRETKGKGVDDVIVALGFAKVQEESLNFLAFGGVANFFGGTKFKDRMIRVDTHRIHYDSITMVGSSGSDPSDVARALKMIADGLINPGNYVVRCGGMDAATSLIRSVRQKEIDGKGVIYPHTRSPLFRVNGWNLERERVYLNNNLINS